MFAVIFEVQPKKERWNDYLDLAKFLKPRLEAIEGFVDIERFSSKRTEGRLLSLSTWRDEKAVVRWRTQGEHHGAQEKGRLEIFEDYHLRVGEVTDDSAPPKGLSIEQKRFDETEIGEAKVVTITELTPAGGQQPRGRIEPAARLSGPRPDHRSSRRSRGLREHLQSGQASGPGILAQRGCGSGVDAEPA